MNLRIYRSSSIIASPFIANDNDAKVIKKIMSDDKAEVRFALKTFVNFILGDYITFASTNYYLNDFPEVKKISEHCFEYTCTFESVMYELRKVQFRLNGLGSFPYTGKASDFLNLIVSNMNRAQSGWTAGTVITSDYKTLKFEKENCLQVLQRLAKEFNTEFYLNNKQVNLTSFGTTQPITLKYGYFKGLYSITRNNPDKADIVTRVFGEGSSRNIPANYRNYSKNLKISTWKKAYAPTLANAPASTWTTTDLKNQHLNDYFYDSANLKAYRFIVAAGVYSWSEITDATLKAAVAGCSDGGVDYYEKNVSTYGLIEKTEPFEDIYPRRTGTISSIAGGTTYEKFTDSSMDFDLNSYLVPGEAARISFKTGTLTGTEFEVVSYNNSTKQFEIKYFDDGTGMLPNATLKPAASDKYVILNIIMTQSYINAAEDEQLLAMKDYIDKNSLARAQYSVDVDYNYCKKKGYSFSTGNSITISDDQLSINRTIRIISLTQSIRNPYLYTFDLGDYIPISIAESLKTASVEANRAISIQQSISDSLNVNINSFTSDNILSASEKLSIRKEWQTIAAEKSTLLALATANNITTEKTDYDTAFFAICTYLNGGTTFNQTMLDAGTKPIWINDQNIGIAQSITGSTMRAVYEDFSLKKATLLKKISEAQTKTALDANLTTTGTLKITETGGMIFYFTNPETPSGPKDELRITNTEMGYYPQGASPATWYVKYQSLGGGGYGAYFMMGTNKWKIFGDEMGYGTSGAYTKFLEKILNGYKFYIKEIASYSGTDCATIDSSGNITLLAQLIVTGLLKASGGLNFKFEELTADPTTGLYSGRIYLSTYQNSNRLKRYNGSGWDFLT